jgi:hypothetical protein
MLRDHCALTQLLSNAAFYQHHERRERVQKYYKGPLPPPQAMTFSKTYRDFFYQYDVLEESTNALQRWKTGKGKVDL